MVIEAAAAVEAKMSVVVAFVLEMAGIVNIALVRQSSGCSGGVVEIVDVVVE